ncbi:MAG: hypothetical protein ACKVWV_14475 [Planctomycetota bacterium]
MRLDSVRELKKSLGRSVVARAESAITVRTVLHRAAGARTALSPKPVTLSLGVSRRSKRDFQLAVRIQRRGLEDSELIERIRKQAKGEVDIRYVGRLRKKAVPWHMKRTRPMRPGCSVGHYLITAGTLGCFVKRAGSDALLMLSNNHVLANENIAKRGDAILQPGDLDGGKKPKDVVGKLAEFVKLKRTGANFVDCATATIATAVKCDVGRLTGLGKLAGVGDVTIDEGDVVAKVGRTTGVTRGRVTAFELDNLVIEYDIGDLRFDDQIEIEGRGAHAFSDGGDSGSLIIDADRRGVALLFAGGDVGGANGKGLTYANPLHTVLSRMKVELVY